MKLVELKSGNTLLNAEKIVFVGKREATVQGVHRFIIDIRLDDHRTYNAELRYSTEMQRDDDFGLILQTMRDLSK